MTFRRCGFRIIVLLFFLAGSSLAQITLCSWNISNFGNSKSDSAITYIASATKNFDIIAIVEVVAGRGGAQSVARLASELNRMGSKWDYCVSDPTTGSPNKSERYAYLWKTARLKKKGDAWLEKNYKAEIEREPYFITFDYSGKEFTVCCFHAIPKSRQPETEIKYFKFIEPSFNGKAIMFCGDFNCPESHTVFIPLKSRGYKPVFTGQKTTLKQKCMNGESLASEYDNIFYNVSRITFIKSGIVGFYKDFRDLKTARLISDHVPVYFQFAIN